MKVLKFGGTSVANADNIQKVIEILTLEVQKDTLVVVVSALGGVTDMLQKTGELANTKDQSYLTLFKTITSRHIDTARTLGVSKKAMAPLEALVKDLEKILQGVYLINECSNKTKEKFARLWMPRLQEGKTKVELERDKKYETNWVWYHTILAIELLICNFLLLWIAIILTIEILK